MPITPNIKFELMEKKDFPPMPANVYLVEVKDIKEILKSPYQSPPGTDKTEQYLSFEFLVLEGKYKGRKIWKDVRPVTPVPPEGQKASWMYRLVSAIIGRYLTKEEGINFGTEETNALINRQLRILVNQTPPNVKGRIYNNITEVLPVDTDLEPLPTETLPDKPIIESLDKGEEIDVSKIPF